MKRFDQLTFRLKIKFMKTFSSPLLLPCLTLTGLVGMGLMGTVPASAMRSDRSSPSAVADLISPVLPEVMSQAMQVAQAQPDIIDTAMADGSFQTLLQLLDELGMTEDLRGFGRFTVFAPTDAAFAALPSDIMEKLSDDRELMSKVLAYHVISANTPILSDQISSPVSVRTLERSEVRISKRRGRLYVNSARVIDANIEASNGVIHAIDQVLIPDDIMSEIRR
jgi:uncharacterized surface protein with fasciclin (FAS1) repeats